MTELQIKYDKTCACIPAGITVQDQRYQILVQTAIQGSLSTAEKHEFQARFKESPDTIETQVDMYGALLDDVCVRLDRGVKRLEPDQTKAKEISDGLGNMVRAAYATVALTEVVSLSDGNPLFVGYLQEKLGEETPTIEAIEKAVSSYLSKLKVKEFLDAQGLTAQLIANLEAALL